MTHKAANVETSRELHAVDEYLNLQQSRVGEFSKDYPEIWLVLRTCFTVSLMLRIALGHRNLTMIETHRLVMWNSIVEYQIQSLILLLSGRLDSAYALLRLATELGRDVYCMGDDDSRLTLWLDKENRRNEYRTCFKFDDNNPVVRKVHDVYRLCSQFGVHGHRTSVALSEPVGTGGRNDCLLLLDVPKSAILYGVHIWLMAFATIEDLCASTFFKRHITALQEPFSRFRDFMMLLDDVIIRFGKLLDDLRSKVADNSK